MIQALVAIASTLFLGVAAGESDCDMALVQMWTRAQEGEVATVASGRSSDRATRDASVAVRVDSVSRDRDGFDVTEGLSAINESIGKLGELVDYVNETALDMMSRTTGSIEAVRAMLPSLKTAVTALNLIPGADAYADKAGDLIDAANQTLEDFNSKLEGIPGMIDAYAGFLPTVNLMAWDVMDLLTGAADQIQALQDEGESLVQAKSQTAAPLVQIQRRDAESLAELKTSIAATRSAEDGMNKAKELEALAHLEARAQRVQRVTSLERSTWGKGGKSLCEKAADAVAAANSRAEQLETKVAEANETSAAIIDSVAGIVDTGLAILNNTFHTALEAALEVDDVIPSSVMEPVTSKFGELLDLGNSFAERVQDAMSEIVAKVEQAKEPLQSLAPLSASMADAVDSACATD